MARKPDRPAGTPDSGLQHNPFGALGALSGAVPEAAAPVPAPKAAPKSRGRLVLRRETKHRGGKAVIIVCGAGAIEGLVVADLARELKQQLGCGGTVDERDGEPEIVLSGDRPAKVAELLRARGFRVDGVTG